MIKYEPEGYAKGGLVSQEPSGQFRGRGAARAPNAKKKVDPMDDLNVRPLSGIGYSSVSPKKGSRKRII